MKLFAEEKLYHFDTFTEMLDFYKNGGSVVYNNSQSLCGDREGDQFYLMDFNYDCEEDVGLNPLGDYFDENGNLDESLLDDDFDLDLFVGHEIVNGKNNGVYVLEVYGDGEKESYLFETMDSAVNTAISGILDNAKEIGESVTEDEIKKSFEENGYYLEQWYGGEAYKITLKKVEK